MSIHPYYSDILSHTSSATHLSEWAECILKAISYLTREKINNVIDPHTHTCAHSHAHTLTRTHTHRHTHTHIHAHTRGTL